MKSVEKHKHKLTNVQPQIFIQRYDRYPKMWSGIRNGAQGTLLGLGITLRAIYKGGLK